MGCEARNFVQPQPDVDMPHLAVNNLDAIGDGPGVHAFVVGISDYTHLPGEADPPRPASFNLRKLNSPANSAYAFYQWLQGTPNEPRRLRLPLATCHLLLAPSAGELAACPEMGNFSGATVADFIRELRVWRRLCAEKPNAQAIFYFCGHGVQTHDRDAVLLMQDFADPHSIPENGCIRFSNIFEGMAPHHIPNGEDYTNIAREQIYFVDACRESPDGLAGLRAFPGVSAFSAPLAGADERDAPVFFSTTPGEQAFGQRGKASIFTAALLDALRLACDGVVEGPEGEQQWPVRVRFLHRVLKHLLSRRIEGPPQRVGNLQGLVGDPIVHFLPQAPQIETELMVLPEDMIAAASIEIKSVLDHQRVWSNAGDPPPHATYRPTLQLGIYSVDAAHPQCQNFRNVWYAKADEVSSRSKVWLKRIPDV